MVATIVANTTSITTTTSANSVFEPRTIINTNSYAASSLTSSPLTTISNTTHNNKRMSCSIDDANQATSLLIQSSQLDKPQPSLSNTSTSSSSTPSSSSQNSTTNSNGSPSNLISLVTPLQQQNFPKINCVNTQSNQQQQQQQQQQGPTKIVQAGTHYILTTLYQGNSGQKVVSVNPASQNAQPLMLNSQNMASSSSVGSSSSASSNQNPSPLSDQQTTTITLTSPNLQSMQNANQATLIFPLQTQQYSNYVDTNQGHNGQNVNLFSPLGNSSNSQYYTFQSTPNYVQQPSQSASPNRSMLQQDHQQSQSQQANQAQQQQQQQQQNTQVYIYENQPLDLENSGIEFDAHASHTTQAAPITVQWLIDNFEPAEGCSLRRSTLYNYYIHHCNEQRIEPVNPASFGKLIRSVFLGLRTRRLGTRGNSKYHYYGIRVKMNSPLNQLGEEPSTPIQNSLSLSPTGSPQAPQSPILNQTTNHLSHHGPASKRAKNQNNNQNNDNEYKPVIPSMVDTNSQQPLMTVVLSSNNNTLSKGQTTQIARVNGHKTEHMNKSYSFQESVHEQQQQQQQQHQQPPVVKQTQSDQDLNQLNLTKTDHCRNFGHIKTEGLDSSQFSAQELKRFEDLYKMHCERIVDSLTLLRFESIRDIWLSFWRAGSSNIQMQNEYENQLSSQRFYMLCELPQVIEFVKHADHEFYQFCIEILIPDVLGSLPHNLVQSIRALSKNVDTWLNQALCNTPEPMKQVKLAIINTFSMTLRRYTSLNHLAQTVKNSLQNETILAQMLNDINRVDFNYIREQAKWICGCDERVITRLENEFKDSLRNHSQWSLEVWIAWLDNTATTLLREYEGTENYAKMARQFLLKWTFMCSSIVRDLTLRSAPTFGSFHLIRLLYDEYMCYLIEIKIAHQLDQSPLATMCNSDC